MSFRDLVWWSGTLKRRPYWLGLVGLVVLFLVFAITFPALHLMFVPISYFIFCWLANRLRDAGCRLCWRRSRFC